jgi:hypothetical protein
MNRSSSLMRRIDRRFSIDLAGVIVPQLAQAYVKWFSTVVNVRAASLTPLKVIALPFFIQIGCLLRLRLRSSPS